MVIDLFMFAVLLTLSKGMYVHMCTTENINVEIIRVRIAPSIQSIRVNDLYSSKHFIDLLQLLYFPRIV